MDISSETSSDESLKASDKKNKYACTYEGCTASFAKNSKLVYHIRRHTGERPFICDEPNCGKTYLYSFHLRRHKETHHGNLCVERITCTYEGCHRELANKYSLKKHLKRKHKLGSQYPFSCDECQQGFHRKRQLLQHSYIHTGIFPYMCEICETRFPTMRERNRHKRTHTSYSCSCGESFERWSTLLAHKKICVAARPKCNICNKIFKQNITLKYHLESHLCENVATFSCGYDNCNRSYTYKKNLIYHINKYHRKTLVKRIPCTHQDCTMTFSKMQNLKNHINQSHSDNNVKNQKKARKPRKDKGKSRTSMAALLAGLPLPPTIHHDLVEGKPVKLPLVPVDMTPNEDASSVNENVEHSDSMEDNVTSTDPVQVKVLTAKMKENLLRTLRGNKSGSTDCSRNNNETNKNYVKVLC